ncbi:MAG TPA: peroxide stress protein YaaA [Flavobacteriaceae bacterium]|nr:peroxide stress protein YaaA [Flavobacteriaceae bacterium]
MKIIVSPAKSLDFESTLPPAVQSRATQPRFLETTAKINKKLSRVSKKQLSKLMGISDKLAELNFGRNQDFQADHTSENSRPALYTFAGDVYMGLDAYSLPIEKLDEVQDTLRILSGLYGILRPLDLIQPHRLEMGTQLPVQRKKNLYEVWQEKITQSLNAEMEPDELLVNLASQEYFKAVNTKKLKAKVISPIFKDFKNGELKIISFFAKKARGSMARFMFDKNVKNSEGLKNFDYDGYQFSEKETKNDNEPVFIR